ncbi:MAG TPA: hypothetical protein VGG64_08460 [Pirellulales bacterium]|jgi:hypothetical protein
MQTTSGERVIGWLPGLVHLAFFVRYALLVPFLLLLLAFFGWRYRTNAILGNVFLVDSPAQLFQLTWLSLAAVALSAVEARVTLLNAKERFPDCPSWNIDGAEFTWLWSVAWIVAWLAVGLAVPLVCAWATPYGNTGLAPPLSGIVQQYGVSMAAGIVVAGGLLLIASGAARFAIGRKLSAAEILPSDACFRQLQGARFVSLADRAIARVLSFSDGGYVEPAESDPVTGDIVAYRLRPGHAQVAFTLLLLLAGYVVACAKITPANPTVPVLFYLLIILSISGVLLSAASFWLDLYRLPVPLVMLALGIVVNLASQNDHFFAMLPRANTDPPPTLYDVVRTWQPSGAQGRVALALPRGKDGQRTLVVVAAAGGGIQAAAWTAKVLTELHDRYGVPFTRSVRLVSGVSGGSIGLMHYLDRFEELSNAATKDDQRAAQMSINEQARASSLEATAWGVAFFDLPPAILPMRHFWPGLQRDRGSVLESLWSSRLAHSDPTKYTVRSLLDDIQQRGHPIPIFNSTNGATGARFLWSPIQLIERASGRLSDPEELAQAYPQWDLSVVSAARLSATFSYVSPICRPVFQDAPYPRVPFADGGYAENEGILSVLQALTQLLSHYQTETSNAESPPFDRILIVRILPFAGAQPAARTTYDGQDAVLEDHVSASAWRRALTGPLELLTQVRESSQSERGEWEAAQMQAMLVAEARRWAASAGDDRDSTEDSTDSLGLATLRRSLEPFAVTHNLVRRQKTGEMTELASTSAVHDNDGHPLRETVHATAPPLQIASVKFAFTLPGHAGVSHSAKLVVTQTDDEWDDYFTPLSWKMNNRQKQAIDAAWRRISHSDLGNLSPLDEPLFFAPGDEEPSLTLEDLFEHAEP